jgi:sensor c-di-GMP phosphodiesterase-like protein
VTFEPDMHAAVMKRLELEADLRRALERDEFLVYYQPLIHLQTGRVMGVEALVRWRHPQARI